MSLPIRVPEVTAVAGGPCVVEAHCGHELASGRGGAELPRLSEMEPPRSTRLSSPEPIGDTVGTVLVIDDSDIARASMASMLEEAGLKVVELASPIGATRAILEHQVSVVVVDVLMPGMRGDRLATLFRNNPRFARLGVVLVSGESGVELDRLMADTGADAAVPKADLQALVPAVIRARTKRIRVA
jgi:CheY-like chemotaxis protein